MTIDDMIRDEKLQYDINLLIPAKISALSSAKIDKYGYLTDEKILPSDQGRVIEHVKFTYSPFRRKKLQKNKQKRMKIKEKTNKKQLKIMENNWLNLLYLFRK